MIEASTTTVSTLVAEVATTLRAAAVAEPGREARDLLAAVCDAPRFWPAVEPDAPLGAEVVERVRAAARQRAAGAPFAYAVGRAAFRYLTLAVNSSVLIPRQETELLVELMLTHLRRRGRARVLDIGTGSGAIALSVASEANVERLVGTDVSSDALSVARDNASRMAGQLEVAPDFLEGCCYSPIGDESFDVIVSNPPYISYAELRGLPSSVRDWEPPTALVCGGDGLDVTRRVIAGAPTHLHAGGLLALEVDERRASRVAGLVAAEPTLRDVRVHRDLADRERFVTATRA